MLDFIVNSIERGGCGMFEKEKKKELTNNKIIIGSKEMIMYVAPVLISFQANEIVELWSRGSNINKMERIVRLFTIFEGVKEESRRVEPIDDGEAEIVVLRRMIKNVQKEQ